MSTYKKKFFKKTSKFESREGAKPSTKKELKFSPLDPKGYATQATYQQVKDALLVMIDDKIEDDLLDIRSCVEKEVMKVPSEPVKGKPTGTTPEDIEDSKEQNKILYESALKKWDRRIYNLEKNSLKVRSMIWDKFTSKSMKDKLEQLSDYASTLSKDPVALLRAIKLQMHDTVRAQYSEWTRITAMEKLLSFRQQDLSLAEYIIHFKELRDIYVTQNGTGFNNSYVASQTEGFNELTLDEKIKLQKEAYDRWIAIMFIKHADMR